MARPRLVVLTEQALERLDRHFAGRAAQRRDGRRLLLCSILTDGDLSDLEQMARDEGIHGLTTRVRRLQDYLQREALLPEAMCAHYKYRASRASVQGMYRVTDTEWGFVHGLADDLGIDLDLFYNHPETLDFSKFTWHDLLEEELEYVVVSLDRRALEDMLLATLEGYLSPLERKLKGREICGIAIGMSSVRQERRRRRTMVTRYVHIVRAQPQLSAPGTMHEVTPNEASTQLMLSVARKLFPQYEILGDFHSHPYDTPERLKEEGGWRCSSSDEAGNRIWMEKMVAAGERPRVAFVLAITQRRRATPVRRYRGQANAVQIGVGDCLVILSAYRILGSGSYSEKKIHLNLLGLQE